MSSRCPVTRASSDWGLTRIDCIDISRRGTLGRRQWSWRLRNLRVTMAIAAAPVCATVGSWLRDELRVHAWTARTLRRMRVFHRDHK